MNLLSSNSHRTEGEGSRGQNFALVFDGKVVEQQDKAASSKTVSFILWLSAEGRWVIALGKIKTWTSLYVMFVRDTTSWNSRMTGDQWIGKEITEIGHSLIDKLSRHLPGRSEGNHERLQSQYRLSRSRFEPSTTPVPVWNVAATRLCSV